MKSFTEWRSSFTEVKIVTEREGRKEGRVKYTHLVMVT
jgi:hypothetical protein